MELIKIDGFNNIYAVECFFEEFNDATGERFGDDITEKNGRYRRLLIGKLEVLDDPNITEWKLKSFEKLSDTDICAIRFPKTELNPRTLYIRIEGGSVILLGYFKEKSASDYKRNIKKAEERLGQLEK